MPVDDETEMILSPQGTPGVWITDPMVLVSDDVDDDYEFFGVADDMPNDRTHKVTIDSEVVAKYLSVRDGHSDTSTAGDRAGCDIGIRDLQVFSCDLFA